MLLLLFAAKLYLTLWSHELQHTRPLCPPLSLRVCLNSCLLSQWCYPTISSSTTRFSLCFQSFPVSGSFPMSWLFVSAGQTVVITASVSVLPMNIQGWFPLGLTGLISLLFKRLSRIFSRTTVRKHPFFSAQPSLWSSSHIHYMTTEKTKALTRWIFVGKVMSLLFNMLSRFVIAFLPRSKCLFIKWLQSPSVVILKVKKIKSFHLFPI